MITLTIVEFKKKRTGVTDVSRRIESFKGMDQARKIIKPIVHEMQQAKHQGRKAKIFIDSVSYDTNAEKQLLLDLRAITSIENEEDTNGY